MGPSNENGLWDDITPTEWIRAAGRREMTIRNVPGTDLEYYLISYDKKGVERDDDGDVASGRLSERVVEVLGEGDVTDVFFTSHGWKGDVPAAIDQYDRWIGAMAQCAEDRKRIRDLRPGFKSLIVGLHWPSRPWGDEDQPDAEAGTSFSADADPVAALVDDAADKLADSESARSALQTIVSSAMTDVAPARLPDEVRDAFNVLTQEAGLVADGPGGAPGDDSEAFDPEFAYQAGLEAEAISFGGGGGLGGIFNVLRQLSYWKMKKRARRFGESGAAELLRRLQRLTEGRDVQFHLMGHSFGCIAISGALGGEDASEPLVRPADSVYLVQGALSYWAYCADIPVAKGKEGYFHTIPRDARVRGPFVTTQSEHDKAVGKLYPLASQIKGEVSFAPDSPPKYGALGAFGVRGPGVDVQDVLGMKVLGESYGFQPGRVYNIESSNVIKDGTGASGAHNDIDKPEVGHAFWEAVIVASQA